MRELHPELIFDWNVVDRAAERRPVSVSIDDETLRDGLQSPSVTDPPLEGKLRLLHLMGTLGIGSANVGLPAAGGRPAGDAEALCREIVAAGLPLTPNCAARTTDRDIEAVLAIQERVGIPVEVMLFLGSSPIRCTVEGWSVDELARRAERAVSLAVSHGAPATFVTEDTTRSHPEVLRRLYQAAVRCGATRVCIADTAGHADPLGAHRVVNSVREAVDAAGGTSVGVDWHGHNDRGLAVVNALTAARAGADRLHATVRGIGERVGNPPLEQLLVNIRLLGWARPDLTHLMEYVSVASELLGIAIPAGAPVVGRDAFRTSTGIHAAAIMKAGETGRRELEDLVYSAVPASWVGRFQEIEVGPMSGASNARYWLRQQGLPESRGLVARVLRAAKEAHRILSDAELRSLVCSKS